MALTIPAINKSITRITLKLENGFMLHVIDKKAYWTHESVNFKLPAKLMVLFTGLDCMSKAIDEFNIIYPK